MNVPQHLSVLISPKIFVLLKSVEAKVLLSSCWSRPIRPVHWRLPLLLSPETSSDALPRYVSRRCQRCQTALMKRKQKFYRCVYLLFGFTQCSPLNEFKLQWFWYLVVFFLCFWQVRKIMDVYLFYAMLLCCFKLSSCHLTFVKLSGFHDYFV